MTIENRNRTGVARHRGKMTVTHEYKHIWIHKADIARIEALAQKRGWLADTGRNAGQVNFQQAINEILQAGLKCLQA
jgi:hypothetical protein